MAAITADKVVTVLQADVDSYIRDINRAQTNFVRSMATGQKQIEGFGRSVKSSFSGIGAAFAAGLAGVSAGAFLGIAKDLIDSSIRIQNSLKVAGVAGADLARVYDSLFASAQRNLAPVEALATLYGRAAQQQKELGVSSEQLLKFTDDIALALRVSGTSATAAQGALLQLGQALGSGKVQAEEFNSILEGVPTIAQAAARGIKEANGSVAALKQLVITGKVSSKAFFDGFEAGAVVLKDQVADAETTISGGFVRLTNVLTDVAKKFNENSNAAGLMVGFLDELGNAVRAMADGFNSAVPYLTKFAEYLNYVNETAENLGKNIGAATGLDQVAPAINEALSGVDTAPVEKKIEELQKTVVALQAAIKFNTEMGIDTSTIQGQLNLVLAKIAAIKNAAVSAISSTTSRYQAGTPGDPNALAGQSTLPPEIVKPVTLADYPVAGTGKKKRTGVKKTADDRFAEDVQDIKDRTAALAEERAALGLSFEAQQKRKIALDLEQEALKEVREEARKKGEKDWQNAKLSPDQIKAIDDVSSAYARQAEQLRQAQEMYDLNRDILNGAFDDLRSAIADGKLDWQDFADVATNALDKIVDKIQNELVDAILQMNGGAGSTSGILGFLGGLFGGGGGGGIPWSQDTFRASGGPVSAGKAYIVGEKRPELFVPGQSGTIIPSVPKFSRSDGGGAGTTVQIIDNAGTQKTTKKGRGSDGRDMVTVIIDKVREDFATGGFDAPMTSRFGGRPTTVAR